MPTVARDPAAPTTPTPAPRALVRVEREGDFVRVTMDVPERRNALSLEHMRQLLAAVREVGASDARGLLLAAEGPVFCAGHDFGDMAEADLPAMRELLGLCTELVCVTRQTRPKSKRSSLSCALRGADAWLPPTRTDRDQVAD